VTLVANAGDRAVPPRQSRQAAETLPQGRYVELAEGGHLFHETTPQAAAEVVWQSL